MRVKVPRTESRRRPRTKVNWPVVVELDDRVLHGETIDVSELGVKVRLGERLEHASLVTLHLHPPQGCRVNARAIVWRTDDDGPVFLFLKKGPGAIAALPRLLDLKIESSLIGSSLIGVMSQRLVRRVCPSCRQEWLPSPEVLNEFFGTVPAHAKFFRGVGCADCGFSGYKGRMMVADLWMPDEQDAALITRQAPFDEIRQSAQRTTCSMAQDAHDRLVAGTTTVDELLRVLPYVAIVEHRRR